MDNVVALKPKATTKVKVRRTPRAVRISRQQAFTATAVIGVGLVLTALSLTHLSHGIHVMTNAPVWESWAMAIGVDLLFVALELAQMTPVKDKTARAVRGYVRWGIGGTLLGSAGLNALAFGSTATGWMMYPASVFGFAIPGLIFVAFKVGAKMWMDR